MTGTASDDLSASRTAAAVPFPPVRSRTKTPPMRTAAASPAAAPA